MSFLGERGVDGGGPRREFFMLLMGCIASIVDGPPERRVLRHNTTAFEVCEKSLFYYCFKVFFSFRMRFNWLLAKLLVCPFCTVAQVQLFFAPCIIDYLLMGISGVKPCVQDVTERDVQSKLRKVSCSL